MKFNSSLVKPKKRGESDKYSWNLYRAFKMAEKEMGERCVDYKIFWYGVSRIDGSIDTLDIDNSLQMSNCFLMKVYPYAQGTAGRRIGDIFCLKPNEKIELYCYDFALNPNYLVDITEWFWKEYVKSGRCIFDREHNGFWYGDEDRFTAINNHSRRCNWCGEYQRREIEKVAIIRREENWVRA